MKIVILVNTLTNVNQFVYANHIEFFTYSAKHMPDIEYIFFSPSRMSIDTARNTAARLALENDADYLMFIDDDVLIPPNTLELLLADDKDITAGLVVIRGMPFNNMAFKWIPDTTDLTFYNDLPLKEACADLHASYNLDCEFCRQTQLETLVEVAAVGFSCALIKTSVLKAMEPPFFVTGVNHTEDIYFCMKGLELENPPKIYLDTRIKCGHFLNPEPIEWQTRYKFTEFYKEEKAKEVHHGPAHIAKCLAKVL